MALLCSASAVLRPGVALAYQASAPVGGPAGQWGAASAPAAWVRLAGSGSIMMPVGRWIETNFGTMECSDLAPLLR